MHEKNWRASESKRFRTFALALPVRIPVTKRFPIRTSMALIRLGWASLDEGSPFSASFAISHGLNEDSKFEKRRDKRPWALGKKRGKDRRVELVALFSLFTLSAFSIFRGGRESGVHNRHAVSPPPRIPCERLFEIEAPLLRWTRKMMMGWMMPRFSDGVYACN